MHVGHWKFESHNIWSTLVRRPVYQNRIICPLEMVHEYVPFPHQCAVSEVTLCRVVITATLTLALAASVYFFFPDSPFTAHFLTPKERAQAILRIKGNHSGIEQKRFKKHQYVLCSWMK
jgi:hypothetical protein